MKLSSLHFIMLSDVSTTLIESNRYKLSLFEGFILNYEYDYEAIIGFCSSMLLAVPEISHEYKFQEYGGKALISCF